MNNAHMPFTLNARRRATVMPVWSPTDPCLPRRCRRGQGRRSAGARAVSDRDWFRRSSLGIPPALLARCRRRLDGLLRRQPAAPLAGLAVALQQLLVRARGPKVDVFGPNLPKLGLETVADELHTHARSEQAQPVVVAWQRLQHRGAAARGHDERLCRPADLE
eukprot:scaffold7306_cov124-Isochrysis_galbana.AAC.4